MNGLVEVRGVAAMFGIVANRADGTATSFARTAFRHAHCFNIGVQVDFHGNRNVASTGDRTAEVFEGDDGLYFRCWLPSQVADAIDRRVLSQCSIGWDHVSMRRQAGVERVTSAKVDHIAIIRGDAAQGPLTGAWCADRHPADLPLHEQQMLPRWRNAFAGHQARELQRLTARQAAKAPAKRLSPDERALMARIDRLISLPRLAAEATPALFNRFNGRMIGHARFPEC